MNESNDARWLRDQLSENENFSISNDQKWIAVSNQEVVASSTVFGEIINQFADSMQDGQGPLLFYVYTGAFQ